MRERIRSVKFNRIGAIVPGPRNNILDAWAEVNEQRVTQVAVGQAFCIIVQFQAENVGALKWHLAVTAKGGGVLNFFDQAITGDYVNTTWGLNKRGGDSVMPSGTGPLTLNLKVWMNDDWNVSPSAPPEANW